MLHIYTDGASRGNPGNAAWAYVVALGNNQILDHASGTIGIATNNDAEYCAIIKALEYAIAHNLDDIRILSDSEIAIRQLKGIYRCKEPRLQAKKAIIESYTRRLHVEFGNVSREHEMIRKCDRYCNEELNKEAKCAIATGNNRNISSV